MTANWQMENETESTMLTFTSRDSRLPAMSRGTTVAHATPTASPNAQPTDRLEVRVSQYRTLQWAALQLVPAAAAAACMVREWRDEGEASGVGGERRPERLSGESGATEAMTSEALLARV